MKKVILLFFMTSFILCSQNKKLIKAERINNPPKIDGVLNEIFWKDIEPAKEFIMIEPYNGKVERITEKTEVLIAYDDNAIYFGVKLYDQNAHLILPKLTFHNFTLMFAVQKEPTSGRWPMILAKHLNRGDI